MEKTAIFIGHGECWGVDKESVRAAAEELIQKGVETFLSGGMGGFDWLGARVVYELKEKYPHIKNILVIPYLTFNVRNKDLFDEILYPDGFEKYHFKAAIPKRNRFLVDNAKYAICYVTHGWGRAAQTYEYAKNHGLNIVDIKKPPMYLRPQKEED